MALLSDRKSYYIGIHKHVFESNGLYALDIFENFVEKTENIGISVLESSCKINQDRLYPVRFNYGFNHTANSAKENYQKFNMIIDFFHQVETRADVKIDYSILQGFLSNNFDFSKVTEFLVGIDLRQEPSESRLKLAWTLENYLEKQEVALILNNHLNGVARTLLNSGAHLHMGFDFSFNGRSEIELYPHMFKETFQQVDVQQQLAKVMLPIALQFLPACFRLGVGISKANTDKVFYYYLLNTNDFLNYFPVNDTARRVHAYYREQPVKEMCIAIPERELSAGTIQKMNLYYLI